MAIVFDGPVSPDALTTFVRNVPTPQEFTLNQLLPDRYFLKNSIDVNATTRTNRTARFRAFDGRLHVSERDTMSSQTVKLPPLSSSISVGELERLQLEFARTGGTNEAAIIDAIYDDATNLTREVQARMEQARGDVLTDGKFTLAGEGGLYMEADYGVPAGNIIATPATPWSTVASATIIANMTTWVNAYVALNGFAPGGFVCSKTTLGYFLQNTEIRSLAASLSGVPSLVTRQTVDNALDSFSLPPLLFTYDTQVDVDGVSTRTIPADRVIFVPPNISDLGYTAWGISATALELVNSNAADLSFSQSSGIVGVVEKSGPPYRSWTYVDAVGMPVIANPNLLMVADVA
jgi:hypothetical protein